MNKRKSWLVFAALFLAGVSGIVAGRLIGRDSDARDPAAISTGHAPSRIGSALEQAMGLAAGRAPDAARQE